MKLSTRARYGLRAVLELAENYGDGPLQLKCIAEHQDISVKYLEQIMAVLKSMGIVRSVRGPSGGYVLAKKPSEIKLSDCFICLEGSIVTTECVEDCNFCPRTKQCTTRDLWSELQRAVMSVLQSKTLQDILDANKKRKGSDYTR